MHDSLFKININTYILPFYLNINFYVYIEHSPILAIVMIAVGLSYLTMMVFWIPYNEGNYFLILECL